MSQAVHELDCPDPAGGSASFDETVVKDLHRADMIAAGMVFGLMAGIFIFGLVLYTTIAFAAMGN
jgi:hypothetical protein